MFLQALDIDSPADLQISVSQVFYESNLAAAGTWRLLDAAQHSFCVAVQLGSWGQPSKRYLLRIGDLFKVGSTLFHVALAETLVDSSIFVIDFPVLRVKTAQSATLR